MIANIHNSLQTIEIPSSRTLLDTSNLALCVRNLVDDYNLRGEKIQEQQLVHWLKEKYRLTEELTSKTQKILSIKNIIYNQGTFHCILQFVTQYK